MWDGDGAPTLSCVGTPPTGDALGASLGANRVASDPPTGFPARTLSFTRPGPRLDAGAADARGIEQGKTRYGLGGYRNVILCVGTAGPGKGSQLCHSLQRA